MHPARKVNLPKQVGLFRANLWRDKTEAGGFTKDSACIEKRSEFDCFEVQMEKGDGNKSNIRARFGSAHSLMRLSAEFRGS